MTEFDPAPTADDTQRRWQTGTDTFGRVYDAVLGVTSPTAYTEIAELADCSSNAAKKHLDRLTEMGIARAEKDSRPATYETKRGVSRMAGRQSNRNRTLRRSDHRPCGGARSPANRIRSAVRDDIPNGCQRV